MVLDRAVVGSLSHAELVDLVVRQSALIDRLQATIAEQQALIRRLEARLRALEAERDRHDPTTKMPGLKPAATLRRRKGGPRKRRAHEFSRVRAAPTEQVVLAAETCPHCATPLAGGWVAWRKEMLEVPAGAGAGDRARLPGAPLPEPRVPGAGDAAARERGGTGGGQLGANGWGGAGEPDRGTTGRAAAAGRPDPMVLGGGAPPGAERGRDRRGAAPGGRRGRRERRPDPGRDPRQPGRACRRDRAARGRDQRLPVERHQRLGAVLRAGQSAQGGRRQGPRAGLRRGAGDRLLRRYDHYDGPHQRCSAHLLRDVHALVERHPADAALRAWAAQVHAVYDRARRVTSPDASARVRTRRQCEADLLAICRPYLEGVAPTVPLAVLCRRIAKYLPELFTFVSDPAGTTTFTRLATLFDTWRARGLDPLIACQRLLLDQAPALPA